MIKLPLTFLKSKGPEYILGPLTIVLKDNCIQICMQERYGLCSEPNLDTLALTSVKFSSGSSSYRILWLQLVLRKRACNEYFYQEVLADRLIGECQAG
jgi:hypothetical protein